MCLFERGSCICGTLFSYIKVKETEAQKSVKKREKEKQKLEDRVDKDSPDWLADRLRISVEALTGAPVFILNGKYQLWVENYKSILEYQEDQIRIQTRQGKVRIWGKRLDIDEFTRDGMRIVGKILGVEFQNEC